MEVTVLPNQRRPGVGRGPVSENRRAWLPQQARFCPVLEDASRVGFLVYPPLAPNEAFQVRLTDAGILRTTLFTDPGGSASVSPVFVIDIRPSGGTGGLDAYDVRFVAPESGMDAESARVLLDALVTNVNAPPGAVGLRGASDFVTPPGWDTLYVGLLNEVQRPAIPVLSARVETDWYAQPTEFRYVLQPGEVLSAGGQAPIGQVLFLPREEVTLRPGTPEEAAAFAERQREYWTARAAAERSTNFGTTYSYHYRSLQKERRTQDTPED